MDARPTRESTLIRAKRHQVQSREFSGNQASAESACSNGRSAHQRTCLFKWARCLQIACSYPGEPCGLPWACYASGILVRPQNPEGFLTSRTPFAMTKSRRSRRLIFKGEKFTHINVVVGVHVAADNRAGVGQPMVGMVV